MKEHTAEELIEKLGMAPLVDEGGWFAPGWRSGVQVPGEAVPGGFDGPRETCSFIYYLLKKGEVSRWHQLRPSEVWTWHCGGTLEMTLGGGGARPVPGGKLRIGPRLDDGERFVAVAPPGQWQTTRVVDGDFALVSCVVAPGFCDEDCYLPHPPIEDKR